METHNKQSNLYNNKFESYYVVWKHKYMEAEKKRLECLNRTM